MRDVPFCLAKGFFLFLFVWSAAFFSFTILLLPLPPLMQLDLILQAETRQSKCKYIRFFYVHKSSTKNSIQRKLLFFSNFCMLCAFIKKERKKKWKESWSDFFLHSFRFFSRRLSAVVMISVTVVQNCLC